MGNRDRWFWFGRAFFGYARDMKPLWWKWLWRKTTDGDNFWSVTLSHHTFAVGWLSQ